MDSDEEMHDGRGRKRRIDDSETGKTQKATMVDDDSEEEDQEEDEDSSEWEVDAADWEKKTGQPLEEIMTDFEAHPFGETDYDALRRMLSQYCGKTEYDCSQLVDLIISQKSVGSAVRHAETMYTYGYITVVPMSHHKQKPFVQQIKKHCLSSCPGDLREKVTPLLESDNLGLLLNDRIHNIPHAIAPHLHETTSQEIIAAQQEGNNEFSLNNVLYITSFTTHDKKETPKKKKKGRRACILEG